MDSEQKPKRKRRTPEEIAAEKEAKEQRRIEREQKRVQREAEKARKDKERDERKEKNRKRFGPWTEEERVEKAKAWLENIYPYESNLRRWDRSDDCSVLGEVDEYCNAEVIGSAGEVYNTSLFKGCSCPDSRYKRAWCCKHQIALARHICGDVVPKPEAMPPEEHTVKLTVTPKWDNLENFNPEENKTPKIAYIAIVVFLLLLGWFIGHLIIG